VCSQRLRNFSRDRPCSAPQFVRAATCARRCTLPGAKRRPKQGPSLPRTPCNRLQSRCSRLHKDELSLRGTARATARWEKVRRTAKNNSQAERLEDIWGLPPRRPPTTAKRPVGSLPSATRLSGDLPDPWLCVPVSRAGLPLSRRGLRHLLPQQERRQWTLRGCSPKVSVGYVHEPLILA